MLLHEERAVTDAVGFLAMGWSPTTTARYLEAIRAFIEWADFKYERWPGWDWPSAASLDVDLAEFVRVCYAEKPSRGHRQFAVYAQCAVMAYGGLTARSLPLTAKSLKAWNVAVPASSPPPVTWEMALAIARWMRMAGCLREACLIVAMFVGYFRVNEALALEPERIALPGDMRLGVVDDVAGVSVDGKTGRLQFVPIREPLAVQALQWLKANTAPMARVGCSYYRLHSLFQAALESLQLQSLGFTLHGLRHGGATHAFLSGTPLETITVQGRWASVKACRHYIQTGRSVLLRLSLPVVFVEAAALVRLCPDSVLGL